MLVNYVLSLALTSDSKQAGCNCALCPYTGYRLYCIGSDSMSSSWKFTGRRHGKSHINFRSAARATGLLVAQLQFCCRGTQRLKLSLSANEKKLFTWKSRQWSFVFNLTTLLLTCNMFSLLQLVASLLNLAFILLSIECLLRHRLWLLIEHRKVPEGNQ